MKKFIRNFCIIAHINHGKSTLADRLLELTGTVSPQEMMAQFLDSHPIERERGITIKLAPVRMTYTLNSRNYFLNLIDTPGHVDFSYEVSRSLAACEGAILVVDAVSGIQAQTVANLSLAREQGLVIIPVVNKIDLLGAQPEKVASEIVANLGFSEDEILFVSAKTGEGVKEIFPRLIEKIPPPSGKAEAPFRGLVFSSNYDSHKGVLVWIRVKSGRIDLNQEREKAAVKIKFLATRALGTAGEIGYFSPAMTPIGVLGCGEVGYLATGIKDLSLCRVGDTVVSADETAVTPLKGYLPALPVVFVSFYPVDSQDFLLLKKSLEKLKLSDASLSFMPESSQGLGKGFRCGFLGLLHAEVIQERLTRDFGVDLIMASPTVGYQVEKKDGQIVPVSRPSQLPDFGSIRQIREPMVRLKIFSPQQHLGALIELIKERRGTFISQKYFGQQIELDFKLPLAEMIIDLYDRVKSLSSGFASFAWEMIGFAPVDAVKLDVLLNGRRVDAFSEIISRLRVQEEGKELVQKLKKLIPRQQFAVAIQAVIGGKVIARETISPFRKDVTAKLYGGDQTRKDKLLKKQKKGKKKLKMIGQIALPQKVFLEVFKR